jgi:hypothetical protein
MSKRLMARMVFGTAPSMPHLAPGLTRIRNLFSCWHEGPSGFSSHFKLVLKCERLKSVHRVPASSNSPRLCAAGWVQLPYLCKHVPECQLLPASLSGAWFVGWMMSTLPSRHTQAIVRTQIMYHRMATTFHACVLAGSTMSAAQLESTHYSCVLVPRIPGPEWVTAQSTFCGDIGHGLTSENDRECRSCR